MKFEESVKAIDKIVQDWAWGYAVHNPPDELAVLTQDLAHREMRVLSESEIPEDVNDVLIKLDTYIWCLAAAARKKEGIKIDVKSALAELREAYKNHMAADFRRSEIRLGIESKEGRA